LRKSLKLSENLVKRYPGLSGSNSNLIGQMLIEQESVFISAPDYRN